MKLVSVIFVVFIFSYCAKSQVLCIKCYNQNARILTDTNNLIINGGFENTTCVSDSPSFCPNSHYYRCDIPNWICTGGGYNTYACVIDTSSSKSIVIEGTKAVYFGNYHCNICSTTLNDTSCINNLGCYLTGIPSGYPVNAFTGYGGITGVSLEQTVNGLTIGDIYLLEFWAGGENVSIHQGLFALDIGFGNIMLRDPPTPFITSIGTRHVIGFTTASPSHTIKFTNWGHIGTYSTELVLDDVRLFQAGPYDNLCATEVNEQTQSLGRNDFPNPFSTYTQLTFVKQLTDASLLLYDVFGERVRAVTGINGSRFTLSRSNLPGGIYFYEIIEKQQRVGNGKLVVE